MADEEKHVTRPEYFGQDDLWLAGQELAMAHDGRIADALADGRLVRPFDTSMARSEDYALIQPARHMCSWAAQALAKWLVAGIF